MAGISRKSRIRKKTSLVEKGLRDPFVIKGKNYTFFIASTPGKLRKLIVPAYALHGLAVLALAQLELVRLRRWEEIAQLACGLWLSSSPFIFHYAHQDHLRFWHWALGVIVSALALFELWQDWNRSDIAGQGR